MAVANSVCSSPCFWRAKATYRSASRNGFGVLALAVQLAHLVTEGSKVIGALRSCLHQPDARHERNQPNKHDRAPHPTHRHYTNSAIE